MKPTSQGGAPPHLSVVVPVKNEAGNIALLIGEIARALADRAPFEVIFVDDGSTDATAAMLKAVGGEHRRVIPIHEERLKDMFPSRLTSAGLQVVEITLGAGETSKVAV